MDTFSKMIVSFSKVFGGSHGSLKDFPANGVAPGIVLADAGAALGGAALAGLTTAFLAPAMALPGFTNLDATTMDARGCDGEAAELRWCMLMH